MATTEVNQLLQLAQQRRPQAALLLVLDEQANLLPKPLHPQSRVLSNRFDVSSLARQQGWHTEFNDFVLNTDALQGCTQVLYRLSKEKRVVEHVLQSAWQALPVGGELLLAGYKNEGCKTFAKRASECWLCDAELVRGDGNLHLYAFIKTQQASTTLQEKDYQALQTIADWQGHGLLSKPGVFAWDRLDEGSRLLLAYLPTLLAANAAAPKRALDLGCGYGLLAVALLQAGSAEVVATDNNAAAIVAATANGERYLAEHPGTAQAVQVLAADCGQGLSGKFDLLLCNPPFHQGFAVEQQLSDRFLTAAQQLLTRQGRALFVVNAFIPLERKAKAHFAVVEKRLATASYAVYELRL
jgi:16S rRNA (guanine1207-N2)-methyltransferase